jgi:hypothetical protein
MLNAANYTTNLCLSLCFAFRTLSPQRKHHALAIELLKRPRSHHRTCEPQTTETSPCTYAAANSNRMAFVELGPAASGCR